jgi:hypothetical protein
MIAHQTPDLPRLPDTRAGAKHASEGTETIRWD